MLLIIQPRKFQLFIVLIHLFPVQTSKVIFKYLLLFLHGLMQLLLLLHLLHQLFRLTILLFLLKQLLLLPHLNISIQLVHVLPFLVHVLLSLQRHLFLMCFNLVLDDGAPLVELPVSQLRVVTLVLIVQLLDLVRLLL